MVNSRIVVKGNLDKDPKVNADGSVNLVLVNSIEDFAPKDMREKGGSPILVKVSKAQWKIIKNKICRNDNFFEIVGYVKAGVNKNGIPFTYVHPINIDITKVKQNAGKSQNRFTGVAKRVRQVEKKYTPWVRFVNEDEYIELEASEINLVEEDHINAKFSWLDLGEGRGHTDLKVAVRKDEDGNYSLLSGMSRYIVASVFNRKVKAFVTELSRDEFLEKYEIRDVNIKSF